METSVVSVKRSAVASALNEGMPNSKNASVEQSVIMEEGPTQDAVTNGGDDSQNFDDDKLTIYEVYFKSTPGPPEILTVIILMAFGYGAVVSVVPSVMVDRFARLNHGYNGTETCSSLSSDDQPEECDQGSDDAQNAAAMCTFVYNIIGFFSLPVLGSMSDAIGRRVFILTGLFVSLLPQIFLLLVQEIESMSPYWYYAISACTGCISWFAIMVSSVSDVIAPKWRTAAYGITSVGFSIGFSLSPAIAEFLSDDVAIMTSLFFLFGGFLFAYVAIPETLSKDISGSVSEGRHNEEFSVKKVLMRPIRDLAILNRVKLFRMLAIANCLSYMAFSAEYTLIIYYVTDEMDFTSGDVAALLVVSGIIGMIFCGLLLKPLNSKLGERRLLIWAFAIGAVHDVMYGFATSKWLIFMGSALFGFTNVSYPAIASIKANNVDETEQGIIQGALFSVSSLASAIGPLSFRVFYYAFQGTKYPGLMFLFGAFLFSAAGLIAFFLPESQTNSNIMENPSACAATEVNSLASTTTDLHEPLLSDEQGGSASQQLLLL